MTPIAPNTKSNCPAAAPLNTARQTYDAVKARAIAGVATRDELEQAQAALAVAEASAHLSDARAAHEQKKRMVTAGVASVEDIAPAQLAVTEGEVALYQAQIDQQQLEVTLLQRQLASGTASRAEVDTATRKLEPLKMQIRAAKVWRRSQRLSVLETRLFNQKKMLRAGLGSQSDVDKAQTEYDAAVKSTGID